MKLSKIADISIGIILARKQDRLRENNIYIYDSITLKSIQSSGIINKENLEKVFLKDRIDENLLTKKGDVVIRLSEPYIAIYIDENLSGLVVPSNFAIIRLFNESISGEFLKFYLNSSSGRKEILKVSGGSNLNTINISNLKQIEIKMLDEEKQRKFVKINRLFIKEEILLTALIDEKRKYLNSINKIILAQMEDIL